MRIECRLALIVFLATWLIPAVASAQGSVTGVVRDTSGAVLPGVTVEASSPALIEKTRSAVTDSSGQYRIEDLRPGSYVVTFTLTGFSIVRREGIELTGSLAALVNAELRVGALEETITVSGETPVVDVVNVKQQSVLDNEVIAAIPTARLYHSLVTLVPGVSLSGNQDVGGLAGPLTVTFNMRGGPGNEGRLTVDGLSLGASLNGTGVSYTVADVGNAQEVVFSTAGLLLGQPKFCLTFPCHDQCPEPFRTRKAGKGKTAAVRSRLLRQRRLGRSHSPRESRGIRANQDSLSRHGRCELAGFVCDVVWATDFHSDSHRPHGLS